LSCVCLQDVAREHSDALNAERQELIEEGNRLEEMTNELGRLEDASRKRLADTETDLAAERAEHFSTKNEMEDMRTELVELELACSNHEKAVRVLRRDEPCAAWRAVARRGVWHVHYVLGVVVLARDATAMVRL
jgi:chromosome segregation ATPase